MLRVTPAAVEVMFTVFAVTVPPVFVWLPEDVSDTVPMTPVPAARLPAILSAPAPTVSANVELLPADDAFRFTAAAVSFTKLTFPVELAVSEVALIVFAPAKVMPPVPAVKLVVAELSEPPAVIPLPVWLAFNVNAAPELPFKVMPAVFVSMMLTVPVASETVNVLAFNEPAVAKSTPPVPALRFALPALRAPLAVSPLPA